ncbi:hypothetical protein ACLOJK_026413 [Asimina triloba]
MARCRRRHGRRSAVDHAVAGGDRLDLPWIAPAAVVIEEEMGFRVTRLPSTPFVVVADLLVVVVLRHLLHRPLSPLRRGSRRQPWLPA